MRIDARHMPNARHITTGMSEGLEWVYAYTAKARGLIFVPPLIGGHALQHVRELRRLLHGQFNLFSFNYAGHGRSRGNFSLQSSLDNTVQMLDLAVSQGERQQLPVYGVASCFAAMPLLKAISLRSEPLSRIVLVNAVPSWRLGKAAGHFLTFWRQSDIWRPTLHGMTKAMRAYRDELLPGLVHRRQAFGVLSRDRVHWPRLLCELFSQRIVPTTIVQRTDVLCVYGQRDHLLRQIGFSKWSEYEARIQSICRKVQFRPLNSDHFLVNPPVRGQLIRDVIQFLAR